jgi:hypothetical protein
MVPTELLERISEPDITENLRERSGLAHCGDAAISKGIAAELIHTVGLDEWSLRRTGSNDLGNQMPQ